MGPVGLDQGYIWSEQHPNLGVQEAFSKFAVSPDDGRCQVCSS